MTNQIINVPLVFWVLLVGLAVMAIGLIFVKNAKNRKTIGWVGGVITGLAVVGILAIAMGFSGSFIDMINKPLFNQSYSGSIGGTNFTATYSVVNPNPPTLNVQVQASGCSQNPAITLGFSDQLKPGTSVTVSGQYKDKSTGTYLGYSASTLAPSQVVQVINNASGYLSKLQNDYTVLCGNQIFTGNLAKYANGTIAIYNDARTGVLVNSATGVGASGTVNETASTASRNWEVDFTGTPFYSTGQNLVIVELGSTTNISTISMSGNNVALQPIACPAGYTQQITASKCQAFEVPAVISGIKMIYNLQVTSLNGNSITGAVYTTWLPEQAYVDSLTSAFVANGAYDSNSASVFYTTGKQTYNFLIK